MRCSNRSSGGLIPSVQSGSKGDVFDALGDGAACVMLRAVFQTFLAASFADEFAALFEGMDEKSWMSWPIASILTSACSARAQ